MKIRNVSWQVFAFLLPAQFAFLSVLIVYVSEPGARIFIAPGEIVIPAVVLTAAAVALFLALLTISRNPLSAAVYSSLIVIALVFLWQVFLLVFFTTLVTFFILRWRMRQDILPAVVIALQIVSLVLVCFYGIQYAALTRHVQDMVPAVPLSSRQLPAAASPATPDIYYIILDGYGRQDMLASVHGFDNSAFIAKLEQRGFVIPAKSQANYPRTLLSLSASLNMEYLHDRLDQLRGRNYWWYLALLLQDSAVRAVVEEAGYKTVFFASGWDFTDIRDGDLYMTPYPVMLRDFARAFIEMTNLRFLASVNSPLVSLPNYDTHRSIILYQFHTIPEVAALPGPKFVFAHIVNPHPPFVFDQSGAPIDPSYAYSLSYAEGIFGSVAQYRASYLAQLTFDNQMTLTMIDGILSNSDQPPIIIIQGDHGPGIFSDFNSLENTCLYERYSILNAYLFPAPSPLVLPVDISPVNTFRLIFSAYFDLPYPLLPEERFFSENDAIYDFQDVTSLTEIPCKLAGDGR